MAFDLQQALTGSDLGLLGLMMMDASRAQQVRPSIAGALLQSLQGVQQWRGAEQDRAMRQQLQQAQIDETRAQAQERQAHAAEQQRKAAELQRQQQLLREAFAPTAPIQANAVSGVTGPRPAALDVVGQRKPIDWQGMIAAGIPADLVKHLAEAPNLGRAEVARTVEGMDAQGRPATLQFDKFGQQVGQGVQQWKAPERIDTGGQINIWDPVSRVTLQTLGKTNTPDALLSAQTTMRGQNMTDARAREKNSIDQAAVGKVDWKQDVNGNWIALPKEINGAGPVTPIMTTAPGKREQQAQNALGIIDEATKLIDKGTSSYIGAGADLVGRAFGMATPGAVAGSQLKALEGALMMAQPRMEGPQSDKDVALYRQMAGQIGDTTVPADQKKAALQIIRALHARYAGPGAAQAAPQPQVIDFGSLK